MGNAMGPVDANTSGEQATLSIELRCLTTPSPKDLIHQFDQLFETHYDPLYRYLVLTGSAQIDADEILQEAFLRLLRSMSVGKHISKPREWLFRVCYNVRLDGEREEQRWRRATPEELQSYLGSQPDPQPNPESAVIEQENHERLRSALSQLTQRQCEYLLLRAEGMKLREIAGMHGVSVQSVADSCARAMVRLGKLIHD
jgi:RNA polymerase sigma-70 factor, ECF subfamily